MERTELRFHWQGEESCNIYLDGELIFHMNHDNLDWYSMGDVERAFRLTAEKAGWRILSIMEPEEED